MFADALIGRAIYAGAAILMCHAMVLWTGAGYQFEFSAPNRDLNDLPDSFGPWQSASIALEPQTAQVMGAEAFILREYRKAQATPIGVHLAYWASHEYPVDVTPHHPGVCYTGSGWEILDVTRIEVDTDSERLPIEVMLLERNNRRIVTAHWYQMGPYRFTTQTDARAVHRQLWGKRQWPPTLKVLLQSSATSIDSARERLEALALELYDWTSEF